MGIQTFKLDQQTEPIRDKEVGHNQENQVEPGTQEQSILNARMEVIAQALLSFSRNYHLNPFSYYIHVIQFLFCENFTRQDIENHLLEVYKIQTVQSCAKSVENTRELTVLLLGKTGAGKSTTIHFLSGSRFIGETEPIKEILCKESILIEPKEQKKLNPIKQRLSKNEKRFDSSKSFKRLNQIASARTNSNRRLF